MHRIDGAGATVDNKFTQGNPVTGVPATTVTDAWLNAVQEEIVGVITETGIPLDKSNNGQLLRAFAKLASRRLDSFAELRLLDKTKFSRAFVGGANSVGDGRGGFYFLDETDTTSLDNGTGMATVIVGADGGRWKLVGRNVFGDGVADYHVSKSGAHDNAVFQVDCSESFAPGAGQFRHASVINHVRTGGNGHRQALTGQITVSGGAVGEMNVGACAFGFMMGGSGNIFGLNAYAQSLTGVLATAEVVGGEINTDVRANVARKVGLQIIDVNTSVGLGTAYDAGQVFARQQGAAGFQVGIQFGLGVPGTFGIKAGGTIIHAASDAPGQLRAGIDFLNIAAGFSIAPILLAPNTGGIAWGISGQGGSIVSNTAADGMKMIFTTGATVFRNNAGTADSMKLDDSQAADKVFIYTGGALRQVLVGAADSGGAGYKMLRVLN